MQLTFYFSLSSCHKRESLLTFEQEFTQCFSIQFSILNGLSFQLYPCIVETRDTQTMISALLVSGVYEKVFTNTEIGYKCLTIILFIHNCQI